jgi:hypothetical protein
MTKRTLIIGLWLVVSVSCDADHNQGRTESDGSNDDASASNGANPSARDGSVDVASSSDAGTDHSDSDSGLSRTCGWSPPFRLGSASSYYYDYHDSTGSNLVHDASGAVVVIWREGTESGENYQTPFYMRVFDPSTEQWTEESPIATNFVGFTSMAHDAQGSILLFALDASTSNSDLLWSRLDLDTHRWSQASPLGLPNQGGMGNIIASTKDTYSVDYPIVSRFSNGVFEASKETQAASEPYGGTTIDIDRNGNLVAVWREVTDIAPASPLGGLPHPMKEDLVVSFYDASTHDWSTPERIVNRDSNWQDSDGAVSGPIIESYGVHSYFVVFAADGDAHLVYSVDEEWFSRRWDATVKQWTDPQAESDISAMYRDKEWNVFISRSCADEGCIFREASLDPKTDTWSEQTVREEGVVDISSSMSATAGDHVVVAWIENCDSAGLCVARASHRTGVGEWSVPTTIATSIPIGRGGDIAQPLVIGENGTAAFIWMDQPQPTWPYDNVQRSRAFVVRSDPSGDSWSEPVELDTVANVDFPGVTVDPQGAITAVWEDAVDPETSKASDLWTSRYACWSKMPEGTPRETVTQEPDQPDPPTLPAPGCIDPADSGCGPCGWGTVERITTDLLSGRAYETPVVGINSSGRAVVAWTEMTGLYVATRAPDGSWSSATLLLPLGQYDSDPVPEVFVDDSGAALALWGPGSPVWTYAAPSQTAELSWTTPTTIPGSEAYAMLELRAIIAAPGNVVVPWYDIDKGAGGLAQFDFASRTWSMSPSIEGFVCGEFFTVKVDASGNLAAYWMDESSSDLNGNCGGPYTLRVLRRPANGSWSEPENLGEIAGVVAMSHLSPDDAGNVGILWSTGDVVSGAYYDAASGTMTTPQRIGADAPCSFAVQIVRRPLGTTAVWSNAGGISGCDSGETAGIWASELNSKSGQWSAAESLYVVPAWTGIPNPLAQPLGNGVLVSWTDEPGLAPMQGEQILAMRLPSSSEGWESAQVLDGPLALEPRVVTDQNGNALAIWERVTGDSWVLYGDRFGAARGSWSGQPVAISQERAKEARSAFDLGISPSGKGILSWSTEKSIWATVFDCK